MSEVEFSEGEKRILIEKIKTYFDAELDQDIGQFDAEFLLTFFSKEMGVYFYNRGLNDAQFISQNRMESITDAIYDIEKPTDSSR
ncbi:MAG: DUF2164 domain-containing protein [Zetaproteobacteria bacterium]|nr:DUF2164 domain-containing protein [Zetaproteobacteria bacterium]